MMHSKTEKGYGVTSPSGRKYVAGNVLLAALAGGVIWALSPFITGHREPWDSDSPYYLASLLFVGFLLGLWRPYFLWSNAVGMFLGH